MLLEPSPDELRCAHQTALLLPALQGCPAVSWLSAGAGALTLRDAIPQRRPGQGKAAIQAAHLRRRPAVHCTASQYGRSRHQGPAAIFQSPLPCRLSATGITAPRAWVSLQAGSRGWRAWEHTGPQRPAALTCASWAQACRRGPFRRPVPPAAAPGRPEPAAAAPGWAAGWGRPATPRPTRPQGWACRPAP